MVFEYKREPLEEDEVFDGECFSEGEYYDLYGDDVVDSDRVFSSLRGWCAYAFHANTFNLRKRLYDGVVKELVKRNSLREVNRKRKS